MNFESYMNKKETIIRIMIRVICIKGSRIVEKTIKNKQRREFYES